MKQSPANKNAKSKASTAGISERDLENSKKEDLTLLPQSVRHGQIRDAVVKNNLQSKYHAK